MSQHLSWCGAPWNSKIVCFWITSMPWTMDALKSPINQTLQSALNTVGFALLWLSDCGNGNSSRESVSLKLRKQIPEFILRWIKFSWKDTSLLRSMVAGHWPKWKFLLLNMRQVLQGSCTALTPYCVIHAMRRQHHIFVFAHLFQHANQCWCSVRNLLFDHHRPLWVGSPLGGSISWDYLFDVNQVLSWCWTDAIGSQLQVMNINGRCLVE